MWPGRVRRVGSAVVWDPGGPEAFQEPDSLSSLWPWGLTPGRPQLGDDLSVKPRARELGPWSASLVWSSLSLGLGAVGLDFGQPPGGYEWNGE